MQTQRITYLLPNLLTAGSIFTGTLSIIKASKGDIETAAWLIVLALLFDAMDGRIARLTHTTSRFGVEFDSLADIISFGIAPAMLLYFSVGHTFEKLGVMVSALYVVLGAVRLARFNVSSAKTDPNVFIGLPIPASALFIAMWTLLLSDHLLFSLKWLLLIAVVSVSLAMVSNIRYPAFKSIPLQKSLIFKSMVAGILLLSLLYLYSVEGLALVVTLYVLYGPVRAVRTLIKRRPRFKR